MTCMLLVADGKKECNYRAKEEMLRNFKNCSEEFKKEYNDGLEKSYDLERVTCQLVDNLIGTCGEIWNLCHTKEMVLKIKENQVKQMLKSNSDQEIDIENCSAVRLLR